MVVLCSAQVHVSNTRMVKPHFIDHVSLALAPYLHSQDICATDRTWHLRLSIRVRASRGVESIARGPFPWEVASDIGMSVHPLRASLTSSPIRDNPSCAWEAAYARKHTLVVICGHVHVQLQGSGIPQATITNRWTSITSSLTVRSA